MKLSLVTTSPEVEAAIPVALLSGSFAARMEKAARLGYDGVELMTVHPDELDANEIRGQTSTQGLEIAAIASGAIYATDGLALLAASTDVSHRAAERLHALIRFAAAVEAPLVTVGGFRGWLAWAGGADTRDRLIETLGAAAEAAAGHGVRLVIEPLNRYESDIVNNAKEGLALIEQVNHSHLGLLLDTFHMNIEEPSLARCVQQVMATGRLWHIHLGDSNRLPPGQGHLDFPGVVGALRGTGYVGYLSAELLAQPDPDAAAEATIGYMRQLVPMTI